MSAKELAQDLFNNLTACDCEQRNSGNPAIFYFGFDLDRKQSLKLPVKGQADDGEPYR